MTALATEIIEKPKTRAEFDAEVKRFFEEHWEEIEANTPYRPVITKDDEWYYEDIWDKDCARLPHFKTGTEVIAWREQNNGYY